MVIEEFIRNLPKADLSVHLEGCLDPALAIELARRNKIQLPYDDVNAFKQAYRFGDLDSFLKVYHTALSVLVTEEDFYDLTVSHLKKAAAQKNRHIELSFDAQAHLQRGVSFATMINGINRALLDGLKQLDISSHLIMSFMRQESESAAFAVFEQALPYRDLIVAVGLDASEVDNPPEKFKNVFRKALDEGFLTVATAGEVGPPDYIWQAIEFLSISRIDHGIRCMEDPDLIARLAAKQIPLNLCPISNIKLGLFPSMRQYPLKKMYEDGLFVTVNSDCPAYFDAYLNENFTAVTAALKLNKAMLYELAKNSFEASFMDHVRKQKLMSELDRYYKQATIS